MDCMKRTIALGILFILVISISGCLENDFCKELERELAKNNVTCNCIRIDIIPEGYENLSAEPKCSCMCYTDYGLVNTTIAISESGDYTNPEVLENR